MAMCLGWNTQSVCSSRPPVNAATGETIKSTSGPDAGVVATPCASTSWFWLSAAGILLAGMMKNK